MAGLSETCLSDFRSASDAVRGVLLAALPPGVPPSFREITSARFVGSGRNRKAVGHLVMWDGWPATVEVFVAGKHECFAMWGHRWSAMPGGACSWEGDRWVRCDDEGNVLPAQMALPISPSSGPIPHGKRDGGGA